MRVRFINPVPRMGRRPWCVLGVVVLVLCALAAPTPLLAQSAELWVRVVWGGGEARTWRGTIRLSEGKFGEHRLLGFEADSVAALEFGENAIRIAPATPRAYDGLDLQLQAPLDATLDVDLWPVDDETAVRRVSLPIQQLVGDPQKSFRNEPLDEKNNRLLVRREPGDRLRLQFVRDTLVFAPGERIEFHVLPHFSGLAADVAWRCRVQLVRARSAEPLGEPAEREFRLDKTNPAGPTVVGPFSMQLPNEEGAFDLVASILEPPSLTTRLLRSAPATVAMERRMQVVSVAARSPPAETVPWKVEGDFDPVKPDEAWWKKVTRPASLPARVWPGGSPRPELQTYGNGKSRVTNGWTELAPGGWQALPLAVSQPGRPHVLEVDFPASLRQTLGISVIDGGKNGSVVPVGLDSGIDVTDPDESGRTESHRLIFWPQSKSPYVLLVNRRTNSPAVYGRVRVLSGPAHLPAAALPAIGQDSRLLAAYFDKPLFPKNFGADEALDPKTGRSLDDWATFFQGCQRFVEYLKYVGYNGAIVSVYCDGSALYPSPLLDPTPKFDTGALFLTGQDPQRKDVLELLFRMFDREGLRLIPALQFAAPLRELEEVRRLGGEDAAGVVLVGPNNRPWTETTPPRRGLAPYYNPLNPLVQTAMAEVVDELTSRYRGHASFGGVCLQLGSETFTQLPDDLCAVDDHTIARFEQAARVRVPGGTSSERFALRADFLGGQGRGPWLKWRSETLATFYRGLAKQVSASGENARLYLAASDLFVNYEVQRELRPNLPNKPHPDEALARLGIDLSLFRDVDEVVWFRPQRIAPLLSLANQAINLQLFDSPEVDALFGGPGAPYLAFHEATPHPGPSFEGTPLAEAARPLLLPHYAPSGAAQRRAFVQALTTLDASAFVQGGWMLPLGQEDALRPVFDVFRHLPAERFRTIAPATNPVRANARTQPVVLRTLSRGGRTYFYLVNDAPWPVEVQIEFAAPPGCRLEQLGARPIQDLASPWTVRMAAYDLVGAVLTAPDISVTNWWVNYNPAVPAQMLTRVKDVLSRAHRLGNPEPLPVIPNPSFEQPGAPPPGWIHARGAGTVVEIDRREAFDGSHSLHLASNGPVLWVRSEAFPPPKTGRLALWVHLKIADPARQPPLRLAIEGRQADGATYYRFAAVGLGGLAPVQERWEPFLLPLDDLPVDGLSDLRVGFDLMGPGEAWVDAVRVYDLWFQPHERAELLKLIATADYDLEQGRIRDCDRFLRGYWSRFLQEHVGGDPRPAVAPASPRAPPVAAAPQTPSPTPAPTTPAPTVPGTTPPTATPRDARKDGYLDKFKKMLPQKIVPWR